MPGKNFVKRIVILLITVLLINNIAVCVYAEENNEQDNGTLIEELFGFSSYTFYYTNDKGTVKSETINNINKEDSAGISIKRTGLTTVRITIDGEKNEYFKKYKPELIWIRKGDALMDPVYFGDKPDSYYDTKLETTFLLYKLPQNDNKLDFEVQVPLHINIDMSINGLINGNYYTIDFFSKEAIPEQLKFAYEKQSYTIDELENYIENDMDMYIEDYYDVDTGFRPEKDGFTFRNSDYNINGGVCSGIASITTAKFCNYDILSYFSVDTDEDGDKETYKIDDTYTWYNSIYGNNSIRNLTLVNNEFLEVNSPSYNPLKIENSNTNAAYYYDPVLFSQPDSDTFSLNDNGLFALLHYYKSKNNMEVLKRGNYFIHNFNVKNVKNGWHVIDAMVSYLRQGQPVIVNIGMAGGGHSIVGYKFTKINDDTYRLYCYDSNYPDNMKCLGISEPEKYKMYFDKYSGIRKGKLYTDRAWVESEVYIDFTKHTGTYYSNSTKDKCDYEYFTFDTSKTSVSCTDKTGSISFTVCKGDDYEIITNLDKSSSSEIIAYKTFAVETEKDNEVLLKTYAFYKSGMVKDITDKQGINLSMDMAYLDYYHIKGSKLILDDNYVLAQDSDQYIECYVSFDDGNSIYNKMRVRIGVKKR